MKHVLRVSGTVRRQFIVPQVIYASRSFAFSVKVNKSANERRPNQDNFTKQIMTRRSTNSFRRLPLSNGAVYHATPYFSLIRDVFITSNDLLIENQ